ncbi:alanine racemase [Leptotrichia buccalis]|uniref:Alanine racemase n=1 Tax=Leptotrichia buccalis (strain ATCC 14201 / DSM 1135 / JCM 12969 / NCTC 10249 / C-1013-b) TaxID=523794 RepID=C7NBN5_LEPBD|nr:alanine racemase [Leptotrichia buccalis]ACV39566.1 alanine racemase [Leptotrichia buccalis C-1013-b]
MLVNLEINKENLEKNLEKIRFINKNIICVIKDNAYGLGIGNILPILIENNCNYFAVAYIDEAIKIREILKNFEKEKKLKFLENRKIKIMALNYIKPKKLEYAIENDVELTIFNFSQLSDYLKILEESFENTVLKIHIKVNSGMNRLGFNESEILELIEKIKKYEINSKNNKLEIISIFSHISDAENQLETEKQVEKYENILKIFDKNNVKYQYKHLQASPLLFKYEEKYNYDFARVGMALYGMEPLFYDVGLLDVITVKSQIINIRNVKKNDKISYGSKGVVKRDSKIGIVSIGYAHGLQKQIENSQEAYVLVNGKKAKIVGEICMDMIFVDLTDINDVEINDKVVIVGSQRNVENGVNERITLRQVARWAGTIQDDVLTKFSVIKKTVD